MEVLNVCPFLSTMLMDFPPVFYPTRGLQRDVVYLGWPIAPSYMSPNAAGGGGDAGSQPTSTAAHRSPNKLSRYMYSNSIFSLCIQHKAYRMLYTLLSSDGFRKSFLLTGCTFTFWFILLNLKDPGFHLQYLESLFLALLKFRIWQDCTSR